MSKHTPGPWMFEAPHYVDKRNAAGQLDYPGETGDHHSIAKTFGPDAPANARLISAAPDLLKELKQITERFHSCIVASGTDSQYADLAVESARAAIAKAEGR